MLGFSKFQIASKPGSKNHGNRSENTALKFKLELELISPIIIVIEELPRLCRSLKVVLQKNHHFVLEGATVDIKTQVDRGFYEAKTVQN